MTLAVAHAIFNCSPISLCLMIRAFEMFFSRSPPTLWPWVIVIIYLFYKFIIVFYFWGRVSYNLAGFKLAVQLKISSRFHFTNTGLTGGKVIMEVRTEAILSSFKGEGQQRPRSRSLRERCDFGYSSFHNSLGTSHSREQLLYRALRGGRNLESPGRI